jgi:hypothetical protein
MIQRQISWFFFPPLYIIVLELKKQTMQKFRYTQKYWQPKPSFISQKTWIGHTEQSKLLNSNFSTSMKYTERNIMTPPHPCQQRPGRESRLPPLPGFDEVPNPPKRGHQRR